MKLPLESTGNWLSSVSKKFCARFCNWEERLRRCPRPLTLRISPKSLDRLELISLWLKLLRVLLNPNIWMSLAPPNERWLIPLHLHKRHVETRWMYRSVRSSALPQAQWELVELPTDCNISHLTVYLGSVCWFSHENNTTYKVSKNSPKTESPFWFGVDRVDGILKQIINFNASRLKESREWMTNLEQKE